MKWSEFKKLVDEEVSQNYILYRSGVLDPEIDYIDISKGTVFHDELNIHIIGGELSVTG